MDQASTVTTTATVLDGIPEDQASTSSTVFDQAVHPDDGVQPEVRAAAMWAVNGALGLTATELQSLRLRYGHRFLLEARKAHTWILEPPYDLWPRETGLSFLRRFRSIMSGNRVCGQAAVIALRDRMEFWLARGRPMVTREDMLAARDAALINGEGLGLPPADYEVWNWLGSSSPSRRPLALATRCRNL